MVHSILIIEDNEDIRRYLETYLSEQGFLVEGTGDGTGGLKKFEKLNPDLVILDLGLPDVSGESICKEIKKNSPTTTVIILTAKNKSPDIIEGFSSGADDYVSKPFEADELMARIRARLRESSDNTNLKVDALTLDRKRFTVSRGKRQISLTPKEFQLLEYLMLNKDRIVSKQMIMNRIWMYSPDIESRAVDVYIGYLRKKIDEGHDKKLIQTVRGFGYTIKE